MRSTFFVHSSFCIFVIFCLLVEEKNKTDVSKKEEIKRDLKLAKKLVK
ncbi:hypothetical protein D350_00233 [Enterococcus faecalis VC1B-1]|nr:hypothetical protein D350_00233 [Enterococcus faecalis VC1B-1]